MLKLPFKKLQVWQIGMDLAKEIYQLSKLFPKEELYGLTSQIRRASVSIPSNIAEGSQRKSNKEFANFILIAKGSLAELETQIILAKELNYLDEETLENILEQLDKLNRMLFSFRRKLTSNLE